MEMLPLRERKKVQTRQRILHAAEGLVRSNGYQAVTIAAICQEADIAQRTFFAYFPSKEAVFFYDKQLMLDEIDEMLSKRPKDRTTFQMLRELLISTTDTYITESRQAFMRAHIGIECDNPQFQMYGDHISQQCEDILRKSIAQDLNESAEGLGPTLAAASANSALGTIMTQIVTRQNGPKSKKEIIEILDRTLSFLEAGITALDKPKRKL